ncbi:MAG: hypothetical protein RIE73_37905 [Coleofasciculus sp. C1-SOL-03]
MFNHFGNRKNCLGEPFVLLKGTWFFGAGFTIIVAYLTQMQLNPPYLLPSEGRSPKAEGRRL